MSSIHSRHGSEGPRHDPYSYDEITVKRDGREVTLHLGLGTWATYRDGTKKGRVNEERAAINLFEHYAGISLKVAERAARELRDRPAKLHKQRCGEKYLDSVNGYPGEHFTICRKCGEIVDSYFCRSEIE